MGAWFVESLCLEYDVAVYDVDKKKLKYFFHAHRFISPEEITEFKPDLMINAVSLQHTIKAFESLLSYLPETCIISDIASVKSGLHKYFQKSGRRYVSTHPMFGPTFANIKELSEQNAIIIKESDEEGKKFFNEFYNSFKINVFEYSFRQHDQTIAYSLSIPFTASLAFAACMKKQEAPGTTFKKHMITAKGVLSENNYLLSEILFNPYTIEQIEKITSKLGYVAELVRNRDEKQLHKFFDDLRNNIH